MKWYEHKLFRGNQSWSRSLYLTISLVYLYVFMEWIFFVTKPSFMSSMGTVQDIKVYFLTNFILVMPAILIVFLLWGVSKLANKVYRSHNFIWLGAIVPAFISASLALILIDNFTYTVFGLGIVSTDHIWRSIYAFLFIGIFTAFFNRVFRFIRLQKKLPPSSLYVVLSLLAVTAITFILQIPKSGLYDPLHINQRSPNLPNIILLGIDGVNPDHMSVYGYTRDTTPNIKAWAQNALIAENAFSNGANTSGSLTALLTGKLPLETRVLYPPDILVGEDAYQHLPGILKQAGYYTAQVTVPDFGDAYDRNIKDGFDIANFRRENIFPLVTEVERLGGGSGFYFSALIVQRIVERLEHAFYIKKMENPYEMVTQPTSQITEKERFDAMLSYLDNDEKPVFIHVHMLVTHGPKFGPRKNVFSKGEEQNQAWMVDFYDDAILDFDRYFNALFRHLNKTGKINDTIVILYSDHAMQGKPPNKVPLIFWFPNHQYAGKIRENVQLIDIAPTILDYLIIPQPEWMQGESVLENNLSPTRKIFNADVAGDLVSDSEKGWLVDVTKLSPPFYQLGTVSLVVCNRWFSLNLRFPELSYHEVEGSTLTCNEKDIPSPQQAKEILLEQLREEKYDVSLFPQDIPITNTRVIPSTVAGYPVLMKHFNQ